ncbi:MAG TPA: hypothetical protein VF407_00885, partial [Polyangiaceae bacterium]
MERRWLALVCFVSTAVACGGTDSGLLGPSGSDGDTSDAGSGGGTSDSGTTARDGGGGGGGTDSGGGSGGDDGGPVITSDAGGGGEACPDVVGAYSISKSGLNCGDLSDQASECIADKGSDCHEEFLTKKGGTGFGSGTGVAGEVDLDGAGGFAATTLQLGSTNKDNCVGTWDAASSTMTIVCGSTSALSCTVKLT